MSGARRLLLTVHLVGAGLGVHPGAWRWPASDPLAFASIDRWVESALVAERGLLDAVFLSDAPGLFGDISHHPQEAYYLEPTIILTAMARATTRIGLVGTASTSFNEPYNIARRFQSLDLVSNGRAGWNAVTTFAPVVAANFGDRGVAGREDRYGRGNEFVDVVKALWASWEPEALLADVADGLFTDAGHLVPIHHHGGHFDVRGPLPLPPSEQGHPVIFQAGASDEGRDLAARTADAVFSGETDIVAARAYADDIRSRAAAHGRDGDSVNILPGLMTSIASTEAEAHDRLEALDELVQAGGSLGGRDPSNPRWNGHLVAAGPPEHVADIIERWYRAGAADGFTLMPDVIADGLPAFVDHVIPILQRRGLWRHDYAEVTLRERLGLPMP